MLTRATLGEQTFPTFRYKTWQTVFKLAQLEVFDGRVTLLAGPTFLHINTLTCPARSNQSRRNNQSMHERFCQHSARTQWAIFFSYRCSLKLTKVGLVSLFFGVIYSPWKRGLTKTWGQCMSADVG